MTLHDVSIAIPETRLIGNRFRLQRKVGSGGMGEVYLALDERTQEPCALKLFAQSDEPAAQIRFEREAAVLATLTHPGIVGYRAHGYTSEAAPFLVMEWLDGEDLSQRLVRKPLTVQETLSLGNSVLSALAAAHHEGIIHRDARQEHSSGLHMSATNTQTGPTDPSS